MKVSFLIDSISGMGGTERVTTTLANAFVDHGFEVKIYALEKYKDNIFYYLNDKIDVIYSKKPRYFQIYSFLKKIKNGNEKCIVISMGKLSFESSLLNLLVNNSLILSEHGSFQSHNYMVRVLKAFSFYISSKVVLLTNYDKNVISKQFPFVKNLAVIRNINPYWNDLNNDIEVINNRPKVALAIGRFSPVKNFEALINIWNRADTGAWVLNIIGGGEQLSLLNDMAKKSPKNINILPPSNDLIKYYSNAQLYLMTSLNEGLPMVLIESQSYGIPSISFDCDSGPREIIENNSTGYLVPPGNESLYAQMLNELINDPERIKLFSANCISCAERFSPSRIIDKWMSLI
ncbi:glycosyltransferase [Kluyvera sichuanensis]|uniref:glycosyltransferase n=1 Tax=Kluyvera sichuanensis TaxID=2725494 RepID=UPI0039F73B6D